MTSADFASLVGRAIAGALEAKGFTDLMPVQRAVLAPELEGRDLRISSQTGSGKTVAIGLALRAEIEAAAQATAGESRGVARPRALVVVPTRELAKQVQGELAWLYAPLAVRVATSTGGADYREERRAFAAGPAVVVGTPGRLVDHLNRGSIDASAVAAVVLDEADQMLDLGFKEDLEAILAHAPPERRTHLVSATFPRDVRALADRVQRDPAHIEGTPLGTANADIDHVVHLVQPRDRLAAIVNLLLSTPRGQTLVFARTRADVADLSRELGDAGFSVAALSGEMEQRERNVALAAFKRGSLDALVATDVAARGIDVQDIALVVHAEPPTDTDSYTHRSGRTGRAGRKGTSCLLVAPAGLARASQLLRRAGVRFRVEPVPTAAGILRARDERVFAELTADGEAPADPRVRALAARLAEAGDVERTLARLLEAGRRAGPEPREVKPIELAPAERPARPRPAPREGTGPRHAAHEAARPLEQGWVSFRFTWGQEHGADARRLLAMACRRGGIRASDVGTIRVARTHSVVDVSAAVAADFARATREKDPRDPRVHIRPEHDAAPAAAPRGPRSGGHGPLRKTRTPPGAHRDA